MDNRRHWSADVRTRNIIHDLFHMPPTARLDSHQQMVEVIVFEIHGKSHKI